MDNQTQILENLQDIKELSKKISDNTYDPGLINMVNELYIKAHNSIELFYGTRNIQLIKSKYEFSPPQI
jgi:hypothetical protein